MKKEHADLYINHYKAITNILVNRQFVITQKVNKQLKFMILICPGHVLEMENRLKMGWVWGKANVLGVRLQFSDSYSATCNYRTTSTNYAIIQRLRSSYRSTRMS